MKKMNIVALVLIAAAFAAIVSMVGDFSTYQTFATAEQKPGKEYQIIAKLDTTTHAMEFNPEVDPNRFVFFAKDESGATRKVIFSGTKPQDFERSEKLTMTGKMAGNEFHCNKILMKCPSKYKNDVVAEGKKS
jgi:cytochrome c-type biogenesis protein CcmE